MKLSRIFTAAEKLASCLHSHTAEGIRYHCMIILPLVLPLLLQPVLIRSPLLLLVAITHVNTTTFMTLTSTINTCANTAAATSLLIMTATLASN